MELGRSGRTLLMMLLLRPPAAPRATGCSPKHGAERSAVKGGTTQQAWNTLTVKVLNGADNRLSKVPDSITVVVNINLPLYDSVRLLQSTRYRPEELGSARQRHRIP